MATRERCPECGSDDITGRAFDTNSGDESQERYCYACGHLEQRMRSDGGVSWYVEDPAQPPHRMHAAEGVERTLVDEIRATPDDDGPRSVYADYLIERGDPLGTFISLQLARYRRRDPIASAEEQALVDAHWAAWVGLPAVDFAADRVAFERGLWSALYAWKLRPLTAIADPAWSTVDYIEVGSELVPQLDDLLRGPIRRSLRSIAIPNAAALAIVNRTGVALHKLNLAFDTSRDPPPATELRTSPVLHTLEVYCMGEFAPRWVERADAARFTNLVLHAFGTFHPDYVADTLETAGKTSVLRELVFDGLHARRDGDRFTITHVELNDATAEAIANVDKKLAKVRRFVDPGIKLTLPSITPALAELAQRFGHKLVAAPTSFAIRPGAAAAG